MSDPFVGEIKLYGFNFPPRGFAACNGQLLSIAQNTALFSLLGTTYGGDGVTTFALPNLQGRSPVHFGSQLPQGAVAGAEEVTLTTGTLGPHTHGLTAINADADKRPPTNFRFGNDKSATTDFFAAPGALVALAPQSIGNTGNGLPHENMQPFLVMNYCIALNGIFPSRN